MVKKIFFQSSLPRSGSSLLQNVISQNPDFYATPTSGVLELLFGARGNFTNSPEFKAQDQELMKNGFKLFCKEGIEGFFNGITDKPYILDKSRGWGIHYDFLNFFYDEPKIICMVRDLRGVFSSMEKNYRKNQHLDGGHVNHGQMKGTTTEKRVDNWGNSQPVGLAIERLYQIFKEGNNKHILFVKYEDFCETPKTEMERIYSYLGQPYYDGHDFDNVEQITKEDDSVYGIYGDHIIRQKIEPLKKDYIQILGKPTCEFIKNKYKWFFDEFKYI
jgi:sulfotransferase